MSKNKKVEKATSTPRQSRTFTMLIYPEWSFLNNILSRIQNEKYALILHDKDVEDETGELKKPHIHLVVEYGGRRTLTSVQNEFKKIGVESRFIDTCNERVMIRYLIHKDDPDKYQYSKNLIETNMMDVVELALTNNTTSDTAFMRLNEYINNSTGIIKQTEINKYAMDNGLLKGLKAYNSQLNNARVEHNHDISQLELSQKAHDHALISASKKSKQIIDDVFDEVSVTGFKQVEHDGKIYQITEIVGGKGKKI